MLNLLNWNKPLMVNDVIYENSAEAQKALKDFTGDIEVKLNFKQATDNKVAQKSAQEVRDIFRIEVRQYMTKKASPEFDFMSKWNDNKPMPLRIMYGEVLEETKGMVKMRLHGRAEKDASHCSHCMRQLTNPISKIYGIGPICGGHGYFTDDYTKMAIDSEEEIFRRADAELRKTTWEGWIIKKAITSQRIVEQKKVKVTA